MVIVLSIVPESTPRWANVPSPSLTDTATPASSRSPLGVRAEDARGHVAVDAHIAFIGRRLAVEAAHRHPAPGRKARTAAVALLREVEGAAEQQLAARHQPPRRAWWPSGRSPRRDPSPARGLRPNLIQGPPPESPDPIPGRSLSDPAPTGRP